jgi:Leucine-rich repeat (LRR) protein
MHDISKNKIKIIEKDSLADLKSLVALYLTDNKITRIYKYIFSCQLVLKKIQLQRNKLTFFGQ